MVTVVAFLSPLFGLVLDLLYVLLAGFGTYAIRRLSVYLRLSEDDRVRAYLQQAMQLALDYAEAEARKRLPAAATAGAVVEVQALMLDLASDYLWEKVPDALAHFGIEEPGLRERLAARLAQPRPLAMPVGPGVGISWGDRTTFREAARAS